MATKKMSNCKTSIRIGKVLRRARLASKLTQEEYAKSLGISRGFLSDIERGVCLVSLKMFVRILDRTVRMNADQLLGRQPMRSQPRRKR